MITISRRPDPEFIRKYIQDSSEGVRWVDLGADARPVMDDWPRPRDVLNMYEWD